MLPNEIKKTLLEILNEDVIDFSSLSGGCISDAYKIQTKSGRFYFLKIDASSTDLFLKEANGLRELRRANAIRVPEVIHAERKFILTEYITPGQKKSDFFRELGRCFTLLHKFYGEHFGFYENNYIGSNEQMNIPSEEEKHDWIKFYFNKRLMFQYRLAEKLGHATDELKKLMSALENKIENILKTGSEKPSLLHGDLWGGNYIVDESGSACLIDPAVYYGNREADLAMTKLFGGFSSEFFNAYQETYPLDEGYLYREDIYKLYHLLNHLNLFGWGYYSQCINILKKYTR
jgi:fructosamine-3-kinase